MLTSKHLDELLASGIDPELASLNFRSIDGPEIHEHLCYSDKLERLNSGRLSSKWLNRYCHCESGGWWASGLDPFDSWQPMEWGCFKPDRPKEDYQKPGKFIKYEHPAGTETRAFFLRVPLSIWEKIAQRYALALPENIVVNSSGEALGFWAWVLDNPKIPVILAEGVKKAGCLLTHSFIAIALPGIFNGYRSKNAQGNKIDPYLIPHLQAIAQKGRPIYICFDRDEKPQTVRNVNIAISQLGWLFKTEKCEVKVINLPGPEKGVDDFIQAQGAEAFAQLYRKAKSLLKWQTDLLRQLTCKPDVVVSTKYIGSVDIPQDAKLIAFKAPKGSGKTEAIAQLCQEAYQKDQPVIVLTYREQLGRELARRFKLPYKTEVRQTPEGMLYGLSLCVDSCHPESEARFTADTWADALVVIDEIESVIWHLLNSSTCTKNRLPILNELEALFTKALSSESQGRVVVGDADLSDLTLNFVKRVAGRPDLKPYLIQSDYKPETGWDVFNYETPMDLYDGLIGALEGRSKWETIEELIEEEAVEAEAGKHIVFTSGQGVTSKWGTQNLEKDLENRFPGKKILRIDKETVADPNHPAYGCIDNLNAVLPAWDVIIASPVIESGVSIDLHNHFAGVWEFASGVIPTDNVRQTLARLRDNNVPRHIWASDKGLPSSFVGNRSTSPAALRYGELRKSRVNFQALIEASIEVDIDGSIQSNTIALETWLKMACRINAGFHAYRDTILSDLELEGHSVTKADSDFESEEGKSLSKLMAESRDELKESEAQNVVEAHPPQTEAEYEQLKAQKTKTLDQRRSQLHYEIQQRYLAPPDIDIVLKDWDGWYPHLRLHYYLTVGSQYLSDRDGKRFEGIAQSGRSWLPDTNRVLVSHKVRALKALGIDKLFVPGVDWSQDSPEIEEIAQKAVACARDVKLFFGVTVTPENSPMAIVQEIFNQALGFRLERPSKDEPQFIEKGVDANGKRQRARIYNFLYPEDRIEIFDRWLLRDAEAAKETVSSCEQMDHQTHIDLYKDFSDPKPADPSSSKPGNVPLQVREGEGEPGLGWEVKPTPIPPPQSSEQRWAVGERVKAWLGVKQSWEEATILQIEADPSRRFFKAVVQFFNLGGAIQYIWEPGWLASS